MNILMLTDLEGVNGVFCFQQSRDAHGSAQNVAALRLQQGEINAAVRGAFAGGAKRVVVTGLDAHGGPVALEEVDERAEIILARGMSSVVWRQEVEQARFDAIFAVGFHAKANAPGGILSHTGSSKGVQRMTVNGHEAGEVEHIAIRYGALNLPIVLVTGDDVTMAEVKEFLGDQPVYVEVKKGLGRQAGLMPAPKRARKLIEEGAKKAMTRIEKAKPFKPEFPIRIQTEYKDSAVVEKRKQSCRINSTTTEEIYETPEDFWTD